MLVEFFFSFVHILLEGILAVLEILPDFPSVLVTALDSFFGLLFDNMSLLGFFIHMDVIRVIIPLFIVVYNFEHVYTFIMWVVRKIPFVGMK